MHALLERDTPTSGKEPPPFRHLWLELTRGCNLQCLHCQANAGACPPPHLNELATADWLQLLEAARDQRCSSVRFIGGEPLLYPALELLLRSARSLGFEDIEVFTNAALLTPGWVRLFAALRIKAAVSFYAADVERHEAITNVRGSHRQTLQGIEFVLNAGVGLAVGVIRVNQTDEELEAARQFLADRGVAEVRVGRAPGVGRADHAALCSPSPDQLAKSCGSCSDGNLCVTPSGEVFACIMARLWSIENATDRSTRILDDAASSRDRQRAYIAMRFAASCKPDDFGPYCRPCPPRGTAL